MHRKATCFSASGFRAASLALVIISLFAVTAAAQVTYTGSGLLTNFGSQAVGAAGSTVTLNFSVAASTNITSVSVLTTGIANKDFADAGGSTCVPNTYAAVTPCTVNVALTPHAPGLRRGAVVINDGSTNLITLPIYGVGTGPQTVFSPSASTTLNSTAAAPYLIAGDGLGNVYIADGGGQVLKVTPTGVVSTVGSGFNEPAGVAVDGAGNVYVADFGANEVYEVTPSGTQTAVASVSEAFGIVVDGAGNIYVSDEFDGNVYKIAPGGSKSTFASGFSEALGLAVDSAQNVYVADLINGNITQITPGGSPTVVASGINGPIGIAVDSAGSLYYTDQAGAIVEVPAGGSPVTLASAELPVGVIVDGSGNVDYSDLNLAKTYRINRGVAPALSFATTANGSTSTDSPQTAGIQNIGNSSLTIASVSYPTDFPEAPGAPASDCSAGAVAAAAVCTLTIDFSPITANGSHTTVVLDESVKVTDNTLNAAGAIQRVVATGTETKTASTTVLSASSLTPLIGSGYTISATVSGSGATPTGVVAFYSGGAFFETAPLVAGVATLSPSLTAAKHTITATYAGSNTYAGSTATAITVTVGKDPVGTALLGASPNPSTSGTSVTFTATLSTTPYGIEPTGTVKFYSGGAFIGSGTLSSGVATFATSSLPVGTHTITATYQGDANYTAVTSNSVKQTITAP